MKRSIYLLFPLMGLVGCQAPRPVISPAEISESILFQYVDPLEKVFMETAFFVKREAVMDVARGEHATFQFAVRSPQEITGLKATLKLEGLPAGQVRYPGYVQVGRSTPTPSRDRLLPASGFYPDPLLEMDRMDLPAFTTQPVWVTIPIPASTAPGLYAGEIRLEGTVGKIAVHKIHPFQIRVHQPVINRTRLWVTNWYSLSPSQLSYWNQGQEVLPYSEDYWTFVGQIARIMAEYRQNVALISPLRLAEYAAAGDSLRIDFRNFDRTVDIFRQAGVLGRIEGGHLGGRASHWTSPFQVFVPEIKDGETTFVKQDIADEQAQRFYRQFIPALMRHLEEKGLTDIYIQHLADEPITENIDSYVAMADLVRELAPDLKIVEACHARDLNNAVQVWVPQLNFLHEDFAFYQERQKAGDEIWFYTCLAPQGEYANRFVELPLLKTRILHWINYRYDVPGYLHWGLNFWRGDPFAETSGIITESGNVLPGGDAWIIYPGDRKLLSSIRLEAMRDGIVDYELLRMIEEKYPDGAREIARLVVYQFNRYDINIDAFRTKRRQILEMLSSGSGTE